MAKTIQTRIQNKHDLEVNWNASTLIPMQGELIIYDAEVDKNGHQLELPAGRPVPYTYERMKIGDGINSVNDLPFYLPSNIESWTFVYKSIDGTPVEKSVQVHVKP